MKLLLGLVSIGIISLWYHIHNAPSFDYVYPLGNKSAAIKNESFVNRLEIYKKKLKNNPEDYDLLAKIAWLYLDREEKTGIYSYQKLALTYAAKSIHLKPLHNVSALFTLAKIDQLQEQFSKSMMIAQAILKEKPRSPEAFIVLTKANIALGNFAEANHWADELVNIMPSQISYTLRAIVLAKQNRYEEAIFDFNDAIKLDEDDPIQASLTRTMFAQFYIDNYYAKKESLVNAEKLLKEAIRINGESALTFGLMGELQEKKKKNYEASIKYYNSAFQNSKEIIYLLKEARATNLAGKKELAAGLYQQTETLLRDDFVKNRKTKHNDLIRLLLERGNSKDFPEALRLALNEKKIKCNPDNLLLISWAYEVNDQFLNARMAIREALANNFRTEELYYHAIAIEEKLNNMALAKLYRTKFLASSL